VAFVLCAIQARRSFDPYSRPWCELAITITANVVFDPPSPCHVSVPAKAVSSMTATMPGDARATLIFVVEAAAAESHLQNPPCSLPTFHFVERYFLITSLPCNSLFHFLFCQLNIADHLSCQFHAEYARDRSLASTHLAGRCVTSICTSYTFLRSLRQSVVSSC